MTFGTFGTSSHLSNFHGFTSDLGCVLTGFGLGPLRSLDDFLALPMGFIETWLGRVNLDRVFWRGGWRGVLGV